VNDDEKVTFLFGFLIWFWFLLLRSIKDSSSLAGERCEDSNMPLKIDGEEVQGVEEEEAKVEAGVEVKVGEAVEEGNNTIGDF
jgi:uncharacterized protein YdeI (YjbR/CyaY-like superfamily)